MNDNPNLDNSAFSSDKVLDRLFSAKKQASKEANRLFLASLIFVGLYVIRASGLRVDLTLLNTDVGNVPHGLFFFLVAGQISAILCYIRSADAAAIQSRLEAFIRRLDSSNLDERVHTFVDDFEWSSVGDDEFRLSGAGKISRAIYGLTSLITIPTWLAFYLLPIACGTYALINWETQIVSGNISLQFWVLMTSTSITALWFINFLSMHFSIRSAAR